MYPLLFTAACVPFFIFYRNVLDVALPRPQRGFLQISGSEHLTEDRASKKSLQNEYYHFGACHIFVCLFIYLALYLEYTIV